MIPMLSPCVLGTYGAEGLIKATTRMRTTRTWGVNIVAASLRIKRTAKKYFADSFRKDLLYEFYNWEYCFIAVCIRTDLKSMSIHDFYFAISYACGKVPTCAYTTKAFFIYSYCRISAMRGLSLNKYCFYLSLLFLWPFSNTLSLYKVPIFFADLVVLSWPTLYAHLWFEEITFDIFWVMPSLWGYTRTCTLPRLCLI